METFYILIINILFSIFAFISTYNIIPRLKDMFVSANLYGKDLNKKSENKIPEAFGVVSGCTFLITMFVLIPIIFGRHILQNDTSLFPHSEFIEMLAALLSICCMLLLGFSDDVLNLRWRHKLLLPTVASLPLLVVYYINFNSTTIIVPKPFRDFLGVSINLGLLYYVYMGMLAVFCTNAINILAGINGLETGQSLVIAISILIFNSIELSGDCAQAHLFSLHFIIPFIAVTFALLKYNWYPSEVFVGDTYCYFAGMTFAVIGILGHFSKTMLLFFIPQIFNFLYSTPQLFHFINCPRHRIPRLDKYGTLSPSYAECNKVNISIIGRMCLKLFSYFKIIHIEEKSDGNIKCNNLTLINLCLILLGPTNEKTLTIILLGIQAVCSMFAFIIRYPLASLFYEV
uniref:UDP-N-acetylglucosamine--dolichyl-phosphate N-acetylglucosaminephosphotransferase n=1 Tax=Sipha flava TaxID=143950 RepID=A0A2S2QMH6_9HEMI